MDKIHKNGIGGNKFGDPKLGQKKEGFTRWWLLACVLKYMLHNSLHRTMEIRFYEFNLPNQIPIFCLKPAYCVGLWYVIGQNLYNLKSIHSAYFFLVPMMAIALENIGCLWCPHHLTLKLEKPLYNSSIQGPLITDGRNSNKMWFSKISLWRMALAFHR